MPVEAPTYVVRGATVHTMAGTTLDDGMVVVQQGRIAAVGRRDSLAMPQDAVIVDGSGKHLTPGLIDSHVHAEETWELAALLSFGVTTVRNPGTASLQAAVDLKTRAANPAQSPRLLVAGPPIDQPPSLLRTTMLVRNEQQAIDAVRQQARAGVDVIKLYTNLPPNLVRCAIETAQALGLPTVGDLQATSWTQAAQLGITTLCHALPLAPSLLPEAERTRFLDDLQARRAHPMYRWIELATVDSDPFSRMFETLVTTGVAIEPTLVTHESTLRCMDPAYVAEVRRELAVLPSWLTREHVPADTRRYPRDFPERAAAGWQRTLAFVAELHRRGVRLTGGTDATRRWVAPGVSLFRELRLLSDLGLGPIGALRAATVDASRALGLNDEAGTIEAGKPADLVMFDEDPREGVPQPKSVRWVMHRGLALDPGALRSLAREARGHA